MSYLRLVLPAAVLLLGCVSGCGSARMIQSSPDGGVVAIPSNNNAWPCSYRDHAEKLMAMRCPNGYDIVREEEVVVGVKTTTGAVIDPVRQAGYQQGPQQTNTSVFTTTRPQKEYRITFRAHQLPPAPVSSVTTAPMLAPVPGAPARVVSTPTPPGLPSRPVPAAP